MAFAENENISESGKEKNPLMLYDQPAIHLHIIKIVNVSLLAKQQLSIT